MLRDSTNLPSHLEPGLAAKPPLPSAICINHEIFSDDIFGLKCQHWFPESFLEPDTVNLKKNKVANSEMLYESEINKSNNNKNTFKPFRCFACSSYYHLLNTTKNQLKDGTCKEISLNDKPNVQGNIIPRQYTPVENLEFFTSNINLKTSDNPHNNLKQHRFPLSNLKAPHLCYVNEMYTDSNIFQGSAILNFDDFNRIFHNDLKKNITLNHKLPIIGPENAICESDEALSVNKYKPCLVTNDNKKLCNHGISDNCDINYKHARYKETFAHAFNKSSMDCDEESENVETENTILSLQPKRNEKPLTHNHDNVFKQLQNDNSLHFEESNFLQLSDNSCKINDLMNEGNHVCLEDDLINMDNNGLTENVQSEDGSISSKITNNIQGKTVHNINKKNIKLKTLVSKKKTVDNKGDKSMEDEKRKVSAITNSKSEVIRTHSVVPVLNPKAQGRMPHEVFLESSEWCSGTSTFEDIVSMIKVLEREGLQKENIKAFNDRDSDEKFGPHISSLEKSSSAKEMMTFLDDVERGVETVIFASQSNAPFNLNNTWENSPSSSCFETLLHTDVSFLAQQVTSLKLQLENSTAECKQLENHNHQCVELLKQHKFEATKANKRQQEFVDKLIKEKRQLAIEYESAIHELESKNKSVISSIEERHKIEMKKAHDKFIAAEKIKRDNWIAMKTKKIKELTVRGLEPELQNMATIHQEEITELRQLHQRQLAEVDAAWTRRFNTLREQEASERQAAIIRERETTQYRLEQEIDRVEKSVQEQRRRLMEEVRQEKDLLSRESKRTLIEEKDKIERKVEEANKQLQTQLALYEKKYKDEVEQVKKNTEMEKQMWLRQQLTTLEARESALMERLKHERDQHIELAIRRLETDAAAKEEDIENKLKQLKGSHNAEVNDLDRNLKELRDQLKEAQAELQKSEDNNLILSYKVAESQNEIQSLKQALDKLRKEFCECKYKKETELNKLRNELLKVQRKLQDEVNGIYIDKERQLNEIYNRVKLTVNKKEKALGIVVKQRDAALEECGRLNILLKDQQRQGLKKNY